MKITAEAENAIEYHIDLGDNNSDIIINTSGMVSHMYAITGFYSIEVKVFGTSGRFLSKSKDVSVQVGESTSPIDGEDGYITPLNYDGMAMIWQDK